MKKAIAEQWVKALRSGDYEQGVGQLRLEKDNSFCCLGVLCNLHAMAHPKIAAEQENVALYLGESSILPHEVADWADMRYPDGQPRDIKVDVVIGEDSYSDLADANDCGCSFTEIANWIEKNYKEL